MLQLKVNGSVTTANPKKINEMRFVALRSMESPVSAIRFDVYASTSKTITLQANKNIIYTTSGYTDTPVSTVSINGLNVTARTYYIKPTAIGDYISVINGADITGIGLSWTTTQPVKEIFEFDLDANYIPSTLTRFTSNQVCRFAGNLTRLPLFNGSLSMLQYAVGTKYINTLDVSALSLLPLTSIALGVGSAAQTLVSHDLIKLKGTMSLNKSTISNISLASVIYDSSFAFDINGLVNCYNIICDAPSNVYYTGTSAALNTNTIEGKKIDTVSIPNCTIATNQLDTLLQSLAASNFQSGAKITLKGVRSSVSDAAMATLASKGVSVTVTP